VLSPRLRTGQPPMLKQTQIGQKSPVSELTVPIIHMMVPPSALTPVLCGNVAETWLPASYFVRTVEQSMMSGVLTRRPDAMRPKRWFWNEFERCFDGDFPRTPPRRALLASVKSVSPAKAHDELIRIKAPDLSSTGMFIAAPRSFPEGTILSLKFRLAVTGVEVRASFEVRYCLPGAGIGVEFIGLSPEATRDIERELSLIAVENTVRLGQALRNQACASI
jgi:PilZ domain